MERVDIKTGFTTVDHAGDPNYYVGYLDTTASLDFMQGIKRRTYEAMRAQPGARLLDVGCGMGDDVRALAVIVGPGGSVVGIDNSEKMVAEALKRTEGLDLPVEFQVGNAAHLDFEDNSFDGVRAERILIHLEDPQAAIAEMVRVTRPGGHLVTMDADWDTLLLDAPDRDLTRKVLNLVSDAIRNNWIARQVPGIFKHMGLQDVTTGAGTLIMQEFPLFDHVVHLSETIEHAVTTGLLDPQEIEPWRAALEERGRQGLFFGAMTGLVTVGRKPA